MAKTCAESIPEALRQMTDAFPPEFCVNEKSVELFLTYCKLFDAAIAQNHGRFTGAHADDRMNVHLCATMETVSVPHPEQDPLHFLIGRANEVNIESKGEDLLEIDIAFNGVWEIGGDNE